MTVHLHRSLIKQLKKMSQQRREMLRDRLKLFQIDPFHPQLNNHGLHGAYEGVRSINIGGDWRALYRWKEPGVAVFFVIGTHSQLYS